VFQAPTGIVRVPVPEGTITMLPGQGNYVALTVDDGTNPEVLAAYIALAQRTGLRLTFFANGYMPSWTNHAPDLRPLVDQGQALVCNHTWSHRDLTRLSEREIVTEIQQNEQFLTNTYGSGGRPFLRPPYGTHNHRVDRTLAALGYPAVTMWWGSLADSTPEPPAQIVANAETWILPQRLVIGHANHPGVLSVMDQIVDIIHERNLQPVHLADIFDVSQLPPVPPMPTAAPSPKPSASATKIPTPSPHPTASPTGSHTPTPSPSPSHSTKPKPKPSS
jgi:peptidoglycan/xylan/chitin deacetylase (PgdA/CDA1 family)